MAIPDPRAVNALGSGSATIARECQPLAAKAGLSGNKTPIDQANARSKRTLISRALRGRMAILPLIIGMP